jgi:glycosyltransferase involved in cell wall biosynthesis
MPRLSALVCAHAEEKRLASCLEALRFADELVVVLDRCTDRSAEIARRHADRVVSGAFPLEGSSRIAGLEACKGDWILEINEDEQVGLALAEEIRDAVNGAIEADHFLLPIDHYAGHRLVRLHRNGSTETRLYRRGVRSRMRSGGELINPLLRQFGEDFSGKLRHLWWTLTAERRPALSHGQAAE